MFNIKRINFELLFNYWRNQIFPSYYCKICTTTILFSFLIKDVHDYEGFYL